MSKNYAIFTHFAATMVSIYFTIIGSSCCAAQLPPEPETIWDEFNSLWQDRKFDEFRLYTDGLVRKHSDYLPVKIADLIRNNRWGEQTEIYIKGLEALRDEIQQNPAAISPAFIENLNSEIEQQKSALQSYLERGIGPEERLKKYVPPNVDTQDAHLLGLLVSIAPPVVLSSTGDYGFHDLRGDMAQSHDLSSLSDAELQRIMGDYLASQAKRLAAAQQFGKVKGGAALPTLVEILSGSNITAQESAALAISEYGSSAVPRVLSVLKNSNIKSSIENAAFALARIGVATPEVLDALKARMAEPYFSPYVESVVTYLEGKR